MRTNTASGAADLDPSECLKDQLALLPSKIDKPVMFKSAEGIAIDLSIDDTEHILKKLFVPKFAIYAIKDILSYMLLDNSDFIFYQQRCSFVATRRTGLLWIGIELYVLCEASPNGCSPNLTLGFRPDIGSSY